MYCGFSKASKYKAHVSLKNRFFKSQKIYSKVELKSRTGPQVKALDHTDIQLGAPFLMLKVANQIKGTSINHVI